MPRRPSERYQRCTETDANKLLKMQGIIAQARHEIHMLDVATDDFEYQIDKIVYHLNQIKRAVDTQYDTMKLKKLQALLSEDK